MDINLTWKDNADHETEQKVVVSTGPLDQTTDLLKVGADIEAAMVSLTPTHPSPAWLSVVATNGAESTTPASFHVTPNGPANPLALRRMINSLSGAGIKHKVPTITEVTPDFDGGFGRWSEVYVIGNGMLLAVDRSAPVKFIAYDGETFAKLNEFSLPAGMTMQKYCTPAVDGAFYFVALVEATGKHTIYRFTGSLTEMGEIPDGEFLDNGVFLSDTGMPRWFSSDQTDHWFTELNVATKEITKIELKKPNYGPALTNGLDGYNERIAYANDDQIFFVRTQVQNGSTFKLVVTNVNQQSGSQEQRVVDGMFVDLNSSQMRAFGNCVQWFDQRGNQFITVFSNGTSNSMFAAMSISGRGVVLRVPTGEVAVMCNLGSGSGFRFYDRFGKSTDDDAHTISESAPLGNFHGMLRVRGGILFFSNDNKVARLVSGLVDEVTIDGALMTVSHDVGGMSNEYNARNGGIKLS